MAEPKAIVFVVDDDASVREGLGSLIRSAGLGVETFASAQEFLARSRVGCAELSGLGCTTAGSERARPAEADGGGQHRDSDYFYYGPWRCSNVGAGDESGSR